MIEFPPIPSFVQRLAMRLVLAIIIVSMIVSGRFETPVAIVFVFTIISLDVLIENYMTRNEKE